VHNNTCIRFFIECLYIRYNQMYCMALPTSLCLTPNTLDGTFFLNIWTGPLTIKENPSPSRSYESYEPVATISIILFF
jgi:hypothetical protein